MKTLLKAFVISTFLCPFLLLGQSSNTETPYIEVHGTAIQEVIPDEIFISISINERNEGKNKVTIAQQEEELKKALVSQNIDINNLMLSDANADYVRVGRRKNVVATTEYLLLVNSAEQVGKVFSILDDLKIKDANIHKVNHSKIHELRKEVRIEAIKAAKDKADYLLEAIGAKTGKPLIVREQQIDRYNSSNLYIPQSRMNEYMPAPSISSKNSMLEFEKIKIKVTMFVKFAIE